MIEKTTEIGAICSSLIAGGYTVRFQGFSAIDIYLGLPALPFLWIETNADIAVLARHMEKLRYPGAGIADCAVDAPEGTFYFRCLDTDEGTKHSFPLLSLTYDLKSERFQDPLGIYSLLRKLRERKELLLDYSSPQQKCDSNINDSNLNIKEPWGERYRTIMEASLLLSRYGFNAGLSENDAGVPETFSSKPAPEIQRAFLCCLLVSQRPDLGLEFLKRSGLLKEIWPELASFDDVDHSKEFHPEGNVWNHTLETFRYRKTTSSGSYDLRLSLALLLHDAGKPISASFGNHRFNGHAELGARAAVRFMERLDFEQPLVNDIFYLVKNHMLPAALKRLPLTKTAEIMESPIFPALLELYRCDESSSFKGLEGYYENSAAYQTYLRNLKNPYRSANGKKIGKRELINSIKSLIYLCM